MPWSWTDATKTQCGEMHWQRRCTMWRCIQGLRGRTVATGHLIWDMKIDFTWKVRWVLDGHKTPDPIGSTFAGVVSRESVRITFAYAALNGMGICVADICNAYLQALSSQWDYTIGKSCIDTQGFVWWQICGKGFQEPPEVLHAPT